MYINIREYRREQSGMDNPKKLTTLGTQDRRRRQTKQKNTTQCGVDHHYTQAKK